MKVKRYTKSVQSGLAYIQSEIEQIIDNREESGEDFKHLQDALDWIKYQSLKAHKRQHKDQS